MEPSREVLQELGTVLRELEMVLRDLVSEECDSFQDARVVLLQRSLWKASRKLLEPETHREAESSWLLYEDRLLEARVQALVVVELVGENALYDLC